MTDLRTAAQQALWAPELDAYGEPARAERDAAIDDLRAALAEREACAKACEAIKDEAHALWDMYGDPWNAGQERGAYQCAAAIRARGVE